MANVQVFKTADDFDQPVEIVGVGYLGPNGKGGAVIDDAAAIMTELQDENGEPLSGSKLKSAAQEFADERGIVVSSVSEDKVDDFPVELGQPEEHRPPPGEVAEEEYEHAFGGTPDAGNAAEVAEEAPTAEEPPPEEAPTDESAGTSGQEG